MIKRKSNSFALALISMAMMIGGGLAKSPEDRNQHDNKQEVMLLGPLPLGEIYQKMGSKKMRHAIPDGGGPTDAEILEATKRTRCYIIARKRFSARLNRWLLDDSEEYKLVLQGSGGFRLKNRQNERFDIHIRKVQLVVLDVHNNKNPPLCLCRIAIEFNTSPYRSVPDEPGITALDLCFDTTPLQWDVNGKLEWQTTKSESRR